jgi:hypothetical protein
MADENAITKADLDKLAEAIDTDLNEMKIELLERMERTETNLLNAFRQWSLRFETRVGIHSTELSGLDSRFALVEERLAELERKFEKGGKREDGR